MTDGRSHLDVGLPHVYSGKVRDLYDAGQGRLLVVASDRLSAFDVVMAEPVPDKGRALTALSTWWFGELSLIAASHLLSTEVDDLPPEARDSRLAGRMMLVRRCEMVPLECIVRGHLAGSAWKEYRESGTVHAMAAPTGLLESSALPEPMFTPSTKAAAGVHDENLSFAQAVDLVGVELATAARDLSLRVFRHAASLAAERGIIIADTKFELGLLDGRLVLADEVLTPDSSRFWPAAAVRPGTTPPSFDKQPVRDELEASGWDKRPPPPPLSAATIAATRARYVEVYERLSGRSFADWPGGPILDA